MELNEKDIKNIKGLSSIEADLRLKTDGYNELPSSKKKSFFKVAFEVLKEPMLILLEACGVVYLFLGDTEEALMLLGAFFVIIGITIYQEVKTERALDALKDLSSPRALVIRDGEQKRIAGREVVKDDIVIIREGDRIPADAMLLWGFHMTVDESLLTGESLPVRKLPSLEADFDTVRPGGEDQPFLFSGCLVVQGQGLAKVYAAGINTEVGKIGKSLQEVKEEKTFLHKETDKIVKNVFIFAVFLSLAVIIVYGFTRGNWLNGILYGLTLAMALIPEEFPVVLTVFLALGAWRIARKNVLTRKAAEVEVLGAATVICVDKTGTLTENKMSVKKLYSMGLFYDVVPGEKKEIPEEFHEVIEYAILASKKDPFDPMEKSLIKLGHQKLKKTEHLHEDWHAKKEYPLSGELLAISNVYDNPDGKAYVVSAKGAPEAIADLCHVDKNKKAEIKEAVILMAEEGLRVLGVAKAGFDKMKLPLNQHDFEFEFIGLVGLADPVRESVPGAIQECYRAGIRVVMITGDYPVTARNIAVQIGLNNPDEVITGDQLSKLSDDELRKAIQSTNIFARVVPEQKLSIVNALKSNGDVVAMTGDGVNDAPALKSANIGIAMGERGTDVARESAGLVLIKDDFTSIVAAVKLGRRIFDNLKKAMAYIISVHVPIAGLSLIPIILGWPVILFPIHIVFLELIIDPACSVVFESEPEESNTMNRPPRDSREPLFGKRMLTISALQGILALIIVLAVHEISGMMNNSEAQTRTLTFVSVVASNLFLILTNRTWSKAIVTSFSARNKSLAWVIPGVLISLVLVIYVPFLQNIFKFDFINPSGLLLTLFAGFVSILWFELVKVISARKKIDLLKN
jgi:Ca2+-transporting ATPase